MFLLGCKEKEPSNAVSMSVPPASLRLDSITAGMDHKEVATLLGSPERIDRDASANMEAWTYFEHTANLVSGWQIGGLTIIMKDGIVFKVLPIELDHKRY